MKKYFVFGMLCLAGSLPAHAQTSLSIGPRVGFNVATATYNYNNASPYAFNTESVTRFEAGLVANIGCRHFSLQPAALYSQKGFVLNGVLQPSPIVSSRPVNTQLISRFNYLTFPLNFVYTQKLNGEGLQGFGGGYLGVLLGGKRIIHSQYKDVTGVRFYDSELPIKTGQAPSGTDDFYSRRFDAGLQAGLGYRYRAALLQATYSFGLTNLESSNSTLPAEQNPTYYNRSLQITFSYLFKINKSCEK